ncbi:MAG: DNA topoisomerase 3 [Firmicutes bacterium]|nr:DNA topoisomerase 3 [Bacillota bacterium]
MKKLVIAEKPSVGRDIARVLKCDKRGSGFLYNDEYIVSWAVGHLVTLWEPEDYDPELKRWRKESLPILPEELKLKAIAATKDQLDILKKIIDSDKVGELICATDSGREGELIFRYIYEITGCKKPFKRLWISSMTDQAITQGFAALKDGSEYDKLYDSARCRSEADWLVGMNASRAFTLRYNALLSIGRVQTPTLAIIVARQQEIDAFDARDYWELEADFGDFKGLWFDEKNNNDTKIFDKKLADEITARVKGKTGVISLVEQEEKKMPPPLLYDLTELQRDCNRKYGMSAQETLNVAQDLYEKRKLLTYPRTDSRHLSDDMIPQLSVIANKLSQIDEYKDFASYVVNLPKLPITKRIVDNTKISDHHAIIPTNGRLYVNGLSDREFKVFDLVVRRFLSVFYPYYVYSTTKIITNVDQDKFISRGTTVIDNGWKALEKADKEKKGKKETEVVLPDVKQGDTRPVNGVKSTKKKTKPPQP